MIVVYEDHICATYIIIIIIILLLLYYYYCSLNECWLNPILASKEGVMPLPLALLCDMVHKLPLEVLCCI